MTFFHVTELGTPEGNSLGSFGHPSDKEPTENIYQGLEKHGRRFDKPSVYHFQIWYSWFSQEAAASDSVRDDSSRDEPWCLTKLLSKRVGIQC